MQFKSLLAEAMRQLAEAAESEKFNSQISTSYGATGQPYMISRDGFGTHNHYTRVAAALKVGKDKNKVLKSTGIVQVAKIDVS
jgi:hypothetical protein